MVDSTSEHVPETPETVVKRARTRPLVAHDAREEPRWAPPALLLVAVNVIPLLGVLFWGWSLFEVVVLYWFENLVIGAVNILKLVTCMPGEEFLRGASEKASQRKEPDRSSMAHAPKLFLVPFFTFHYGMFCFVHGVFVFELLGGQGPGNRDMFPTLTEMVGEVFAGGTLVAAVALTGSHLYSYVFHFLLRGEFRRTTPNQLMISPYGRIVVLHIAIIFGAFFILQLGQPLILMLLLIGGKTLLDWQLHVHSHRK